MNPRIHSNVFLVVILMAIGIIINFAGEQYAIDSLDEFLENTNEIVYDLQLRSKIEKLKETVVLLETKSRGTLISQSSEFSRNLQDEVNAIRIKMAEIEKIAIKHPTSSPLIDTLKTLVDRKIQFNLSLQDLLIKIGRDAAEDKFETGEGKVLREAIFVVSAQLDSLIANYANENWNKIQLQIRNASRVSSLVPFIGSAIFILLGLYVVFLLFQTNKLYHNLRVSTEKEKTAYRVKDQFIANMSHEVRTPLNSIIGYGNLLKKTKLKTDQKKFLDAINTSGTNLLRIVNDLLDFTKLQSGILNIEKNEFSVVGMLQEVHAMYKDLFDRKRIFFSIALDSSVPSHINADDAKIRQILLNLVGNALKFTDSGSVHLFAKSSLTEGGVNQLQFSVSDTGCGISKTDLPNIFERFFQSETGSSRKHGGTGLGLAISKQLVELMGGSITAKSELSKGTEFIVIVPYFVSTTIDLNNTSSDFVLTSESKGKILIVDDNELNRDLVVHTCLNWNFSVIAVSSGLEALDLLKKETFDLILLDIQMPEMDGYATCRRIRHDLKLAIPIVALTAFIDAGERERCYRAGMTNYISKPFDELELFGMISALIHQGEEETVNLEYLKRISKGNTAFENRILNQFISHVPTQLFNLEVSYQNQDYESIRKILHDLDANLAIVGFKKQLAKPFSDLRNANHENDPETSLQAISTIKDICQKAIAQLKQMV